MKIRTLFAVLLLGPVLAGSVIAAEAVDWHMDPMKPDLQDVPSLQNGFRLYTNYCLGCHSLKFQRYERTADDLQIPHDVVLENMVFSGQKIGEQMKVAMEAQLAKNWFGAPPPDLTMVERVRGAEWIYNYLRTFYIDPSRPLGVNNKVFPNVAMPHALLELQGVQREGCLQVPQVASNGGERRDPLSGAPITEEKCGLLVTEEGSGLYTVEEYDKAVYDLTNFLHYVGDPSRMDRHRIGGFVLLFLVVLWIFATLLGREYNKVVR